MTVLRRLAGPRLRAAWYAAAAAVVLAAAVMTGAIFWVARPWPLAGLAVLAAVLAWQHGTFSHHSDRGIRTGRWERLQRISDSEDAAQRAWAEFDAHEAGRPRAIEAPRRQPGAETDLIAARARADARADVAADAAFAHSAMWQPHGFDAGTPMAAGVAARYEPYWSQPATVKAAGITPVYDVPPPVQALVFDDPVPGREHDAELEVRHHAPQPAQMRPYCSRCGRYGHWTGQEQCQDIVVDELITRRRDGHVAAAIAGHLEAAGLKVYDSEDDAVDSIMMRALNGPRAIEAAKPGA